VSVTAGAATANIHFGLALGGRIAGTVTASGAGTPLPNVVVEAFTAGGNRAGGATTDASGLYTIIGLATGTYYARTSNSLSYLDELYDDLPCPGSNCTVTSGTAVSVTAGTTTASIDFGLILGGTITGTVTDAATGAPLAGIDVRVETAGGGWAGGAATNASGLYMVAGLVTSTYYVQTSNSLPYLDELYNDLPCPGGSCTVTSGTGVSVTAGATTADIDFGLTLGGKITGTVTDAGTSAPMAGIGVVVYTASGGWAGNAATDAAGAYTVADLATGTYYVRTSNSFPYVDELYNDLPCPDGNCTVTAGTGVSVAAGAATANIDFGLTPGGMITGTVTAAGTAAPLANLDVQVYTASGRWVGNGVATNGAGVYTVTGLATGTYYVRTSNSFPYVDRLYDNLPCPGGNCTMTAGTSVSVTAGSVTGGIDFGLTGFGAGDFTGDVKSDILWRHSTGGDLWLWPMDGPARTAETYVRTVSDPNWEIRAIGDFDGDGQADLFWRNKTTGQLYYWPMDGAIPLDEIYTGTVDPAYDIVASGDFNGDGRSDLLWRNPVVGDVWVWLMDGATPLAEVYVDTVDPGYVVKGVGDVDGDLKADLVWHGVAGDVWVWLMNGTARLSQTYVGTVADTQYQIQQVADFDGTGTADLLWWNAVQGDVWVWPMEGTTVLAETYVGTVPDTFYRIQAAGDYNGDGKADILWHHATRGEVWVWLMNGPVKLSETWVATVPEFAYKIAAGAR
jgi:hypothetical protein